MLEDNQERLQQLIENSDEALQLIRKLVTSAQERGRVCWHLDCDKGLEERERMSAEIVDTFRALDKELLRGGDVEFCGPGSVEVWDQTIPDGKWLRTRGRQVSEIADRAHLLIEGWSYEPAGYPHKTIPQVFLEDDE